MTKPRIIIAALAAAVLLISGCSQKYAAERDGKKLGEAVCDLRDAESPAEAEEALADINEQLDDLAGKYAFYTAEDRADIQNNLADFYEHVIQGQPELVQQDLTVLERSADNIADDVNETSAPPGKECWKDSPTAPSSRAVTGPVSARGSCRTARGRRDPACRRRRRSWGTSRVRGTSGAGPVDRIGVAGSEVLAGHRQHGLPRELVGHAHAGVGVVDHPRDGGDDRGGDLHRRGVLSRNERSSLVDRQQGAGPPSGVVVAEQQDAELIRAVDDLVVQDALMGLHVPTPHAQLVDAGDRHVGRAVGVVHRRPVDRFTGGAVGTPHREVVAHRERLTVADHHADRLAARHPRAHPRLHSRLREADLVARAEPRCTYAFGGSRFSWVPQPSSAGATPSS